MTVGLIMGSDSDWAVMSAAAEALAEFEVPYEVGVVSAHRTPQKMLAYAEQAADRGLRVIIAGAGGAAHLPGMVASATTLPVIGVPVPLKYLDGMDSLMSIVQMPAGIPVATMAIGGARNAGLMAVRILAAADPALLAKVRDFQAALRTMVAEKDAALSATVAGGRRQQAPVVIGSSVLIVAALHELAVLSTAALLWTVMALVGAVLIGLGANFEKRRRDIMRLRGAFGRLR